jgi:hypothetical protein
MIQLLQGTKSHTVSGCLGKGNRKELLNQAKVLKVTFFKNHVNTKIPTLVKSKLITP